MPGGIRRGGRGSGGLPPRLYPLGTSFEKGYHYKAELFIIDDEGYHQLPNDSEVTSKGNVRLSGYGSKIIFYSSGTTNMRYSLNSDGTGRIPIAEHGFNFTGMDVTYDGSLMIRGEGGANYGCRVAPGEILSIFLNDPRYSYDEISDCAGKILYQREIEEGLTKFTLDTGTIFQYEGIYLIRYLSKEGRFYRKYREVDTDHYFLYLFLSNSSNLIQFCLTVIQKIAQTKKAFSVVAALVRMHLISMLDVSELLRSTNRGYQIARGSPDGTLQLALFTTEMGGGQYAK